MKSFISLRLSQRGRGQEEKPVKSCTGTASVSHISLQRRRAAVSVSSGFFLTGLTAPLNTVLRSLVDFSSNWNNILLFRCASSMMFSGRFNRA